MAIQNNKCTWHITVFTGVCVCVFYKKKSVYLDMGFASEVINFLMLKSMKFQLLKKSK